MSESYIAEIQDACLAKRSTAKEKERHDSAATARAQGPILQDGVSAAVPKARVEKLEISQHLGNRISPIVSATCSIKLNHRNNRDKHLFRLA